MPAWSMPWQSGWLLAYQPHSCIIWKWLKIIHKLILSLECCNKVWCGKTRMMWLPDSEKFLKICFLVSTEYTNVMDRCMDRWTVHDSIGCAYA